jgi:cell fate regulator YaaT (PSP1 superfamily)
MEANIVGVKFKPVGKIYYFNSNNLELEDEEGIIVETDRGIEYGEVVLDEFETERTPSSEIKEVIRKATEDDYKTLEDNLKKAVEYSKEAKKLIQKFNLGMKLIDSEVTFDGVKAIFTFTAEGRVDFRQLVKELASKLKLRIELKQVGARDESKIIGGIGPCGRITCCANHMREFDKVSIKMAKTQKLALNPSKINGLCNRLMCCLAYENEYYKEINGQMPKIGKKVVTPDGEAVAIYNNLLKKLVTVKFTDKDGLATTEEYAIDDIKMLSQSDLNKNAKSKCDTCPKKAEANTKASK